ncbi:MAG: TonB-dependent receptor, partial [Hymenobacteraceae bacterium]|nr:TonB-dependent receptor [Hymenobacteraceae bacterium]
TVSAGTGLIGADSAGRGRFAVDARASRVQSEAFIDRGFSRLRSLYLTGTYLTDRTLVRALVLTGQERTGQAWYGVPQDSVARGNRTFNPAGYDYDDFAGNQRAKPYQNQTDNYQQDYFQLLLAHQLTPGLTLSATPFYTRGGGYYEEFKARQSFGDYGYDPGLLMQYGDTVRRTNLVRRRWLQTNLYGLTWVLTQAPVGASWTLTLGGAATIYQGHHYGEVIWAERAAPPTNDWRYYDERPRKTDANAYLRGTWQATERLSLFVDAQVRGVRYQLLAPNPDGTRREQTFRFTFFNPKGGLTLALPSGASAYASAAVAQREPTRAAYTNTPVGRQPTAERLTDYEAGLRRTVGRWQWGLNGYWMQYRNQLVLSGKLDDVGNPIPTNVPDSYRAGVEITTAVALVPGNRLTLSGNLTLSRNRIRQYTDYVFDYDTNAEQATAYASATIAYSPAVIGAATLEGEPLPGLRLALLGKHVSRQYLDNTATDARSLAAYAVVDARARYTRPVRLLGLREVEAAVLVANVLSEKYASNGYTYGYRAGGARYDFTYLYPQAPANVLATLSLRW